MVFGASELSSGLYCSQSWHRRIDMKSHSYPVSPNVDIGEESRLCVGEHPGLIPGAGAIGRVAMPYAPHQSRVCVRDGEALDDDRQS